MNNHEIAKFMQAVIGILKRKFPNLTTEETAAIAADIVVASMPGVER